MPVVINARFLTHKVTGVERYATEITRELLRLRGDIILYGPPDTPSGELPVRTVGRRTGHLWEQFDLPKALRSAGSPLLINLMSTAPLRYSNMITTHHDVGYLRIPESYSWKFRTAYRLLVPHMLRRSKAIITSSSFSADEITAAFGPLPIAVIPGAANRRFQPGTEARSSFALAVGSQSVHKNIAGLMAAWPAVRAHIPDAELRIVGAPLSTGSAVAAMEVPGVTYLGRVSDDDLVRLYQTAAVFVMPSLYEGFGIPILEAQASGAPVVATHVAALPEVVGDAGVLVDPAKLADGILEVLTNRTRAEELSAGGLKNAARYSWEGSSAILSRLIDEQLGAL